jgi:pyruvate dehydrogenase E1 component alpha subunit
MPTGRVATFSIELTRYLGPDGRALGPMPEFAESQNLVPLYRAMLLTRAFDTKAMTLQRTGRLGTFASSLGQVSLIEINAEASKEWLWLLKV